MRAEQYQRLKDLQDKLVDVVVEESDPERWSGHGKTLTDLTRDERGDRYWCKRNAAATLSLVMRLVNLTGVIERAAPRAPDDAPEAEERDELEAEIRAAEKEAAAILVRVQKGSRERR